MRNISRWGYSLLAIAGLWQCLASASPATADSIPFFVINNSGNTWHVACGGPWGRLSDIAVPKAGQSGKFYEAEVTTFSPFGDWTCHYATHNVGGVINRQNFCLDRMATKVEVIIPEGASTTNKKPLEIKTTFCSPRSLPPPALTQLQGSATKVGNLNGHSTVSLSGKFTLTDPLALDLATVTVEALLNEVEGAGELVDGLPLVLSAKSGSTANAATYQSVPNTLPRVRLDITKRAPTTRPVEFRLKVEDTLIAQYPQHCSEDPTSTTALALRFTIDDGVNLPFVVEGVAVWACLGNNPQMPSSLKVQGLLPIEPIPSTPEE